jgi:phosphate-selective porin OprO and OprP
MKKLTVLMLLGLASAAHADITVDVIGDHEISFEGLFQADKNYFSNDFARLDRAPLTPAQIAANTLIDDGNTRRAELIFKGKNVLVDWSVAYDAFANKWLDVFYRQKFGSYSTWRIGQYKQPNSLEELTTTKHNDFISKSLTTNAFAIARRLGAEYATGGEPWTFTGSVFSRELTNNLNKTSGYGARFTYAPMFDVTELYQANQVVHLGISYIDSTPSKDTVRLNVRPEADLSNLRLIDSLALAGTTSAKQVGLEAAYIAGPVKVMGEYVDAVYGRPGKPDYSPESYSVSAVWNVTGDKFGYRAGIYTIPVPENDAGLWQVGARYSRLNANSGGVAGGKEENLTLGVNWYYRLNFKLSANYNMVRSERGLFRNDPNVVELRAQIML